MGALSEDLKFQISDLKGETKALNRSTPKNQQQHQKPRTPRLVTKDHWGFELMCLVLAPGALVLSFLVFGVP